MNITSADIAKLRSITGAGMMDCKIALTESDGDFEIAIEYLRKKGQKISLKRADKEANEGVVIAKTLLDFSKGVVVELNCETDFVAKNEDYIKLANKIADAALNYEPANLEELINLSVDSVKINDLLNDYIGKIGEKIILSSFKLIKGQTVIPYIHFGNKIGVLVSLNKSGNTSIHELGKNVAMQIAAMNPIAIDEKSVPDSVVKKEIEIAKELVMNEGKTAEMAEKIAIGKLKKFYKDSTLLNQDFVKDPSKSVGEMIKEVDKDLTVLDFIRISIR